MSGLRRGEVAASAGVNIETVRYYERRGLLSEPDRSPGGHRLYSADAVTVVRVVKAAQRLGFTLDEVSDLLEVGRHHHGRRGTGLAAKAREKLGEVEARIEDLRVMRETLIATIDAGCDDLVACAGVECCPLPFSDLPSAAGRSELGLEAVQV